MHALLSTLSDLALQTAPPTEPVVRGTAPDLTWLMGVVAVLLFTISALAFAFRKVVSGAVRSRAARRDMQVMDVLPLGGKRQLAVVRCYDRTFALGLGEKSVELVAELDGEAVAHDIEQRTSDRRDAFKSRLEAARSVLLRTHDITPQQPAEQRIDEQRPVEQGPVEPTNKDATQEFVA